VASQQKETTTQPTRKKMSKHAITIIGLFTALSLIVLTLWAIKDLWGVILALCAAAALHAWLVKRKAE